MSEWQTAILCSMIVLVGIFGFVVYLNIRLNKVEKK